MPLYSLHTIFLKCIYFLQNIIGKKCFIISCFNLLYKNLCISGDFFFYLLNEKLHVHVILNDDATLSVGNTELERAVNALVGDGDSVTQTQSVNSNTHSQSQSQADTDSDSDLFFIARSTVFSFR